MNESVMRQLIKHFTPISKWGINHKRLWLEYLETGELPFTPEDLHNTIREVVDTPKNRPRGKKLLCLRQRNRFTLKENKTPYRPEEALERFITVTNGELYFNQTPIGGGKESVDIVAQIDGSSLEFIELKPWVSGNSPLYALIEGMKNLIEYRVIVEQQLQEVKRPWRVDVSLLAPERYHQEYRLLNDSLESIGTHIDRTSVLLQALSQEFRCQLAIYSIPVTVEKFHQACARIYDDQRLAGQETGSVSSRYSIPSLQRKQWNLLASSIDD